MSRIFFSSKMQCKHPLSQGAPLSPQQSNLRYTESMCQHTQAAASRFPAVQRPTPLPYPIVWEIGGLRPCSICPLGVVDLLITCVATVKREHPTICTFTVLEQNDSCKNLQPPEGHPSGHPRHLPLRFLQDASKPQPGDSAPLKDSWGPEDTPLATIIIA